LNVGLHDFFQKSITVFAVYYLPRIIGSVCVSRQTWITPSCACGLQGVIYVYRLRRLWLFDD